jgi:integrase
MSPRAHGDHVRKVCGCDWRQWPKCAHPWYFSYKPRSGQRYRFSFDAEFGGHIDSKVEAEKKAATIRAAIDAGTFERAADRRVREQREAEAAPVLVTIEQLGSTYFEKHRNRRTGAPLSTNERLRWDLVMRTGILRPNGDRVLFGSLPLGSIDALDIEALKDAMLTPHTVTVTNKKGHAYTARRGGIAAVRGCLGRVRSFFRWALRKTNHVTQNPFKPRGEPIEGLFADEPGRERRLTPGEWDRLFAAANPHLRALLSAALETACRVGELLSLQWSQVRFDLNEIRLAAKNTKARRARALPMSQRLRSLLEMRRLDPNGREWPATAYVFGDDATGERVKSVKTAWENCRLKAHGYVVVREKNGRLATECRQQLAVIDLRFHDLRREAGSRFLELGMAPHYVQKFLDHANLSTTSRYLKVERQGMHAALQNVEKTRQLEERRAARGKDVAKTAPPAADGKSRESRKSLQ